MKKEESTMVKNQDLLTGATAKKGWQQKMSKVLRKLSVENEEKYELVRIGLQLHTLSFQDVEYIANPETTMFAAERRLRTRRLEC